MNWVNTGTKILIRLMASIPAIPSYIVHIDLTASLSVYWTCTISQHMLIIYHKCMFTQWTRVLISTGGIWSFWSMSPLRTWAKLYANFVGFVRGSEDLGFIRGLALTSLMSVVDIRLSGQSLIYIESKSGPTIEPWGYSKIYDITAGKRVSTNSSTNQTKRYMPVRVVRKI